jgi:hypothetical protein
MKEYKALQIIKHALAYYIGREGATKTDTSTETLLLAKIEERIETLHHAYRIPKIPRCGNGKSDGIYTGKFIGKSSCGFITGRSYRIHLTWAHGYYWINSLDGPGRCPYSSAEALAKNWEIPAK